MPDIETPIRIKNITFKNRIVMAPAVCFGWKCEHGIISKKHLLHYEARAGADVGLIILQSILVNHDNGDRDCYAGIYDDSQTDYLAAIAKSCHRYNAVVIAQLHYDDLTKYRPKKENYHTMTKDRMSEIKSHYVNAIRRCKRAGLDGIEIHGAHTYFLNVLASSTANKRDDEYGGDVAGRLRLVKEMIEEAGNIVDDDFLISYRMGWDVSAKEDIITARYLSQIGVDLLHVSTGIPINRADNRPKDYPFNNCVFIGAEIKKNVECPVIVVNDIRNYERGNWLIKEQQADFAAYGRPLLADGDFVLNSRLNPNYEPCLKCGRCQWFVDGDKCPAGKQRSLLSVYTGLSY